MTSYEYVRLLTQRVHELRSGLDRPVIEWERKFDPVEIAKREIELRVVPLVIIRKYPDVHSNTGFREEILKMKDLNLPLYY